MQITTHVLDGTYGQPARDMGVRLERAASNGWTTIANTETSSHGRVESWGDLALKPGLYRIVFKSESYFANLGISTAYPELVVIFRIHEESETYQLLVTFSPYSYSTHFGAGI